MALPALPMSPEWVRLETWHESCHEYLTSTPCRMRDSAVLMGFGVDGLRAEDFHPAPLARGE